MGGGGQDANQQLLANKILGEYAEVGAVKKVTDQNTRHLIPWFIVSKEEQNGVKHRLISDCRELNQFMETKRFALDNIQNIFPFLKKGQWCAKLDLKDAYFHIPVSQQLKPYLRMKVGDQVWEFQAGCFGLNIMPKLFMELMATFQKKWRASGILCFIYLDDILVLGETKRQVETHLKVMVTDLLQAGFKINTKKSVLEAVQEVLHLGFILNFKAGMLQLDPLKIKRVKRELGKIVTAHAMTIRKMAAILGQVRSFLMALPFLRAFTDQLCLFVKEGEPQGWNSIQKIPKDLKMQLRDIKLLLDSWKGRPFQTSHTKELYSDASDMAWGD